MKTEHPLTKNINKTIERLTNKGTGSKFRQKGLYLTQHQPHTISNKIHEKLHRKPKIHIIYVHHRSSHLLFPSNFLISAASNAVTPPTDNATSNLHDLIGSELSGNLTHGIPSGIIVSPLKQRNQQLKQQQQQHQPHSQRWYQQDRGVHQKSCSQSRYHPHNASADSNPINRIRNTTTNNKYLVFHPELPPELPTLKL